MIIPFYALMRVEYSPTHLPSLSVIISENVDRTFVDTRYFLFQLKNKYDRKGIVNIIFLVINQPHIDVTFITELNFHSTNGINNS